MARSAGILMHITSLPGPEGNGTLGEESSGFVDTLKEAGIKFWQILPLGPTGFGNSPYLCYSAFAGNPLLMSLKNLEKNGLLLSADLKRIPKFSTKKVEFSRVEAWKYPLLRKAFSNFNTGSQRAIQEDFNRFLEEHGWWLEDYALFMALKKYFGNKSWNEWDEALKIRNPKGLNEFSSRLSEEVRFRKFIQFLFFRQWAGVKEYANSKGIHIIGDMPLYVANDSADVWMNPDIFLMDKNLEPTHVGGVPPDYFSETGQLWGNPVYNWERLKERDFDWWMARLHFNLNLFDLARIDHFRGLESFWSVSAGEKTAENGEWVPALGHEMLDKFRGQKGEPALIAEDLGVITPEVEKLRDDFFLPGMKILQFAFSSDATNKDLPHNYGRNFLAYTGTHDNDTIRGWLKTAGKTEKQNVKKYFRGSKRRFAAWAVETVWASVANVAIAPLQDILNLGTKARMNTPGTASGNWGWRLSLGQLKLKHVRFLKELGEKYGRNGGKKTKASE